MAKITREEALAEIARRKQLREQQSSPEESQGLSGVGNDVMSSLASAPEAAAKMIGSIPSGAKNVYNYATTNNPVETLANIGAGGVESGAGLFSAAPKLARYLAEKFPGYGELLNKGRALRGEKSLQDEPTLYESLMNFEKNHGLGAQSEEEQSVRNLGGLLFGGKLLTKLPNMGSRVAALAAQQGGQGGDPLHAAILGMLGEQAAKGAVKGAVKAPGIAVNAVKAIPEIPKMAAKGAASIIEPASDYLSKIPGGAEILQPTVGALAAKLKFYAEPPEEMAQRKLFGDITSADLPEIQERNAAAKRLGLDYHTIAEATNSPFEGAKQGTVGRTPEGSKLLLQKGKAREASEGTAITNLLDTIHNDETLPAQMKAAYQETMNGTVPEDFIARHSADPLIAHAIKSLESDPVYKKALGNTPKNSFEYWDQVKRVLGDMEENASKGSGRKPYQASVIGSTRRGMVDEMDQIKPEYKVARNISERKFTRNKLEKVFDKKKMTGNNFYKFLESKTNFNDTMQKLKAFPEAQQKLKDMKLIFGDLIPNNMSIRAAAALKRTGMSEPRNKLDALKQELENKYGEKHDVASVHLMTNPIWQTLLADYLRKHGR